MPIRNNVLSSLPFFSAPSGTGVSSSRTPFSVPRACLTPRIFLSCVLVTFSVSSLLLYAYSHSSGFRYSTRDSEEWTLLEQHMDGLSSKTMRWGNTTLLSTINCQSTASTTQSFRGTGYNRESVCFVRNLCVDAERGAWIHTAKDSGEFPLINIVAADPGSDAYYRPMILDQFPVSRYRFVDETIYLYGRDPTNKPSWTMNNLLPLHSIMTSYAGTRSSWFMRVSGQQTGDNQRKQNYRLLDDHDQELDTYLLAPNGREIIFSPQKGKPLGANQIRPPAKAYPTCFARAVVGMQSRCTRPYCENLIGGSDLTESLRTKVLDVLAPSMTQFLKPDPDIVHPPSGENAPVVSQANLTIVDGEFAPRSRIQVALLGRYGNTSIPNANALELSLLARGFAVKTIHLDHPLEISLAQAAQLFRNQSILVAPQGDALGYSNWMAPGTVVVSILPRFARSSKIYTDRMMAFGKRFFAWDCRDDSCVQPDRDLAHECIEAIQDSYEQEQGISAQEFEEFANMKQDFRQRSAVWKAITDCYTRDVNRRLNVEELTGLIVGLAKDFSVDVPGADSTPVFDDSTLQRRAAAELDEEDEEELDKEELEQGANDVLAGAEDEEEEEDLDKEGTVRIQVDKETQDSGNGDSKEEGEEQEINVHEYDEQNPSPSLDDKKQDKGKSIAATSTLQPWQPPKVTPLQTAPRATKGSQEQVVRPMFGFGDFCRRGRCCGSAQVLAGEQVEGGGVVSAVKSLTPCAASMSAFVFGDKAVWGLTDGQVTARESQNLVWQVDLARSS